MSMPLRVPTITGKPGLHEVYETALCSPSRRHPNLYRGSARTIVDCYTFYLKKRPAESIAHYLWYIDFVVANHQDDSLTFVAPDMKSSERLRPDAVDRIIEKWCRLVPYQTQVLIVPGTSLARHVQQTVLGHALVAAADGPVHPVWTHSFSRYLPAKLAGDTKLWTYDCQ